MSEDQKYRSELLNVAKFTGMSVFGIFFLNIMGYVINIIITRNVEVELFGRFVLSIRIVSYLSLLSLLGFNIGSVKFISQYFSLDKHNEVLGTMKFILKSVFITSIFFSVLAFIFSPFIATKLFHKPEITNILRILLITVPLTSVSGVFIFSMRGLKLLKYEILSSRFFEPILRLVLLLSFFYFGYKLKGIIFAQLILALFTLSFSGYFLYHKYFKFVKKKTPVVHKKELISFSFPLYLNVFLNNTRELLPIYLMGVFLPSKEIGIFHICGKVAALIAISLMSLNIIFGPTMSGLFARDEKVILEKLLKTATKWIFTISLCLFFILLIYAEPILGIFGAEYAKGKSILIVLIIGQLVNVSVGSNGQLLVMSGRSKLALVNSVIMFIIMGISSIILIPKYGAFGAAVALTITMIIINIIRLFQVFVLENIHPYKLSFIKPIIAGISSFLIVKYYASFINLSKIYALTSGILIYCFLYVLILYILRFEKEDKVIFNAVKQKIKR